MLILILMKPSKSAYEGDIFNIEFYVSAKGESPAEVWIESQSMRAQQKIAALFKVLGDVGKIFNDRKFKHLTGTDQLFEFKSDQGRMLCFFYIGKRVILTHGFVKKGDKTPPGEIGRAERMKADFILRSK